MLKKTILFTLILGITASFTIPSLSAYATEASEVSTAAIKNGWVQSGDKWYYYVNGQKKTGWVQYKGSWYYLAESGAMQTGWVKVDETWYYLNKSGAMLTGLIYVNNKWYFLADNGAMQTKWVKYSDGNYYYFDEESGEMLINTVTPDGYYVDKSGIWLTAKDTIDMQVTAYSDNTYTTLGIPSSYNPNGISTIAVDPDVIPLGSLVKVDGYGIAIAADTRGSIRGNAVGVYFDSSVKELNWGIQDNVKVEILAYPGEW